MQSLDGAGWWRILSVLVLAWLAFFFGRTLRAPEVPLIERIARVSDPALPPPLQRYTRWLTAIWCAYFVLAALLTMTAVSSSFSSGLWVWGGTAILFAGEHWLRPRLFPGHTFPGLVQQVRDTWSVWKPGKHPGKHRDKRTAD
jgi:uncharacterized membrane protein